MGSLECVWDQGKHLGVISLSICFRTLQKDSQSSAGGTSVGPQRPQLAPNPLVIVPFDPSGMLLYRFSTFDVPLADG